MKFNNKYEEHKIKYVYEEYIDDEYIEEEYIEDTNKENIYDDEMKEFIFEQIAALGSESPEETRLSNEYLLETMEYLNNREKESK